ncbi:uncharacterized protein CIMG_09085 [Coccidioides immitis RS]|uniref:Uncharacterized protein n=1 Tax=Coccidioides immitis (strain RS) TaxID=246410 RepID=J3K1K9_COCIM|nr:uncharacterized protein CIMG_09085 [Coccidioides immitis RS]EAS27881.3 hypothetical protein CIMG_09085 [Coccidioides immitis RS]
MSQMCFKSTSELQHEHEHESEPELGLSITESLHAFHFNQALQDIEAVAFTAISLSVHEASTEPSLRTDERSTSTCLDQFMTCSVILAVDYLTSNHDSSPIWSETSSPLQIETFTEVRTGTSEVPYTSLISLHSLKDLVSQTQVSGQAPLQGPAGNADLCPPEQLAVEVPMGYNGLPHPIYPSAVDASIAPGVKVRAAQGSYL